MLSTKPLKQFTPVYHIEYGKGHIVTITYRGKDSLIMCYFPKERVHEWITDRQLYDGSGSMSLTPIEKLMRDEPVGDDLQQALENLFFGGKR